MLHAMGVPRELAQGALRLTLGTTSTEADVHRGVEVVVSAVHQLRRTHAKAMS